MAGEKGAESKNGGPSLNGFITQTLDPVGRLGLGVVSHLGAAAIFFAKAVGSVFSRGQLHRIVGQIYYIGAKSTGIVALVGLFTGMVLGLQLYYTLVKFGSVGVLGSAV